MKTGSHIARWLLILMASASLLSPVYGERVKVNINDLADGGRAVVTHTDFDIGKYENIFDDDGDSLARSRSINPAFVQVEFTQAREIGEFRVRFSHAGGSPSHRWQVEAADSTADLQSQSGSYVAATGWRSYNLSDEDTYTLGALISRRVFALTVERLTGDDYVHINRWELYEEVALTGLEVEPSSLALGVRDTFRLVAFATYDNEDTKDVSALASWQSTDPAVCAVDAGLLRAIASGSVEIDAAYGGISASPAAITVTDHQPDLDVLFLRQTPLYDRFRIDYSMGDQRIRAGYEDAKKWPEAGEEVTYTAFVENKGDRASAACGFAWHLDGAPVGQGTVPPLAPSEQWSTAVRFPWPPDTVQRVTIPAGAQIIQEKYLERAVGEHLLRFEVDTEATITEVTESNNAVEDAINAVCFWLYVDETTYFHFENRKNFFESYSFHDWVRGQLTEFGRRMQASGIRQKIRIDRVLRYPDDALATGGTHTPRDEDPVYSHDGTWGFQYREWGERGTQRYRKRVQKGLVHELGHQLGMIDVYTADLATDDCLITHEGSLVAGTGLMPTVSPWNVYYGEHVVGHRLGAAVKDLTPRGAMGDPNAPYFGPFHVLGMNREYGLRRGYYGAFLGAIPQGDITVSVVTNTGQPVANCAIRVFQRDRHGGTVPDVPKFTGTTNGDGAWTFPAVIEQAFGGYAVNNPFSTERSGTIYNAPHCVGGNSLLVVELTEAGEDPEYHFVSPRPFNNAFAAGQTEDFTLELITYRSRQANSPPVLVFEGGNHHVVREGETLTIEVSATDADGDDVAITMMPMANASYDTQARRFTFTPDSLQTTKWDGYDEDNRFFVNFRAEDGSWQVYGRLWVEVEDVDGYFTYTPYEAVSPTAFKRGDANADGELSIADAVYLLSYLFAGGATPPCLASADANDSGSLDLSDPVSMLLYLFGFGFRPPDPFAACGEDPTPDSLPCQDFPPCH